ncbi:hypothetical protein V7S43_012610 [Phytophthora oleae]|uniref:Uncharacterized protein n=1 Tax=Phytophthora oleae TaxID=2107226 RepID=A0ABD3F616_9STRA
MPNFIRLQRERKQVFHHQAAKLPASAHYARADPDADAQVRRHIHQAVALGRG